MGAGGRASGWRQLTHVKQRASEELGCAEEGPVGAVKILFKFVWPLSTETFKRGFFVQMSFSRKKVVKVPVRGLSGDADHLAG